MLILTTFFELLQLDLLVVVATSVSYSKNITLNWSYFSSVNVF